MDIFLPEGFAPGRGRIRASRSSRMPQLSLEAAGKSYPVLRRWTTGFAVSAVNMPVLTGIVQLREGAAEPSQYLIVASDRVGSEQILTVKRTSRVEYTAASFGDPSAQLELRVWGF